MTAYNKYYRVFNTILSLHINHGYQTVGLHLYHFLSQQIVYITKYWIRIFTKISRFHKNIKILLSHET